MISPKNKSEKTVTHFEFTLATITAGIIEDLQKDGYRVKERSWNATNTSLKITAEKSAVKQASKK